MPKPRIRDGIEIAGSNAFVRALFTRSKGTEYEHRFTGRKPELLWMPEQRAIVWVHPQLPVRRIGKVTQGRAAQAFQRWTGQKAGESFRFEFPTTRLNPWGSAVRILYDYKHSESDHWHHDFKRGRAYRSPIVDGRRVYAVTAPGLKFTARGLVG